MPCGSKAVSIRKNAKSVVAIVWLAISVWLSSPEIAWTQQQRTPAVDTEVVVYGEENAIVDAITKKSHAQDNQTYANELDHVFSVLLSRAHPKPEANNLARHTIDAICKEVEAILRTKIVDSQRKAWMATATRTKSFESVLKDMEAADAGGAKREQLVNAGLTAMLGAAGSKCAGVLSSPEAEQSIQMFETRGTPSNERGMLGVEVSRWPTIKVMPDTPAAEVGLQDGDVVLRVNSREVAKTEVAADGLKALRGAADATISLTVKRGSKILTFEVRRASAAMRIKTRVIDPGVVYIQIPQFEGSGIAKRVKELIRKYVTDATSDVILDLRDNIGGRPEEANGVADIFLDEKCLQIYQFGDGRRIAFKSKPGALDVQVIVLTNENTACAAETLVMALHDNRRATVIGQRTAGVLGGHDGEKLKDGRLIIFRSEPTVLSPTGKDYSETGLPPDILVERSKGSGEDTILDRAIQLVRTRPKKAPSQKPAP